MKNRNNQGIGIVVGVIILIIVFIIRLLWKFRKEKYAKI